MPWPGDPASAGRRCGPPPREPRRCQIAPGRGCGPASARLCPRLCKPARDHLHLQIKTIGLHASGLAELRSGPQPLGELLNPVVMVLENGCAPAGHIPRSKQLTQLQAGAQEGRIDSRLRGSDRRVGASYSVPTSVKRQTPAHAPAILCGRRARVLTFPRDDRVVEHAGLQPAAGRRRPLGPRSRDIGMVGQPLSLVTIDDWQLAIDNGNGGSICRRPWTATDVL